MGPSTAFYTASCTVGTLYSVQSILNPEFGCLGRFPRSALPPFLFLLNSRLSTNPSIPSFLFLSTLQVAVSTCSERIPEFPDPTFEYGVHI